MSTEAPVNENEGTEVQDNASTTPDTSYADRRSDLMRERFGEEPAPRQTEEPADDNEEQTPAQQKPTTPPARKPYQHAVPPQRVEELLSARDRRIAELEAENRLAREGRLVPAQQSQEQTPAAPMRPKPADFQRPDGTFDEDGYVDALTEYSTQKALTRLQETQQQQRERESQEAAQAEIQRTSIELSQGFHSQAQELFADPEQGQDIQAAINFITSNEVATHIPLPVQHEIMRAGPAVAYLLAQDARLVNVLQSGDIVTATKLIATAENYLAQRVGSTQQSAPAPESRQQAPSNNAMQQSTRHDNGQFAPRRQPAGPAPLDGAAAVGTSSYESHRARRMRENGWAN